MDIPKYLHILWSQKWLLVAGLVVAVVAGLFAGYTISDGTLVSRVTPSYRAATTMLVGSASQPIFQAETPVEEGSTGQTRDLTQTAVVYAYLASGQQIRTAVEREIGELADGETITAVRRTTQPGGDESSPGRFSLPILDIIGTAGSADRAEAISAAASVAFLDYVAAEQNASDIAQGARVELTTIDARPAEDVTKSASLLPSLVTGLAIFLLFVVLAFIVWNVQASRAKRREEAGATAAESSSGVAAGRGTMPVLVAESH